MASERGDLIGRAGSLYAFGLGRIVEVLDGNDLVERGFFERAAKLQRVQNADLLIADPRCDKRIVNLKTAEIAEIQTALGVVKEYEGGFRHG